MHDAVAPEELAQWNRWFAVEFNNRAWRLAEARSRSAAEEAEERSIFEATFGVVPAPA